MKPLQETGVEICVRSRRTIFKNALIDKHALAIWPQKVKTIPEKTEIFFWQYLCNQGILHFAKEGCMDQKITWEEIKKHFPDEWIAVVDYERTSAVGVAGTIIAHDRNKKAFHNSVRQLMPRYKKIAVRYTGPLIKNPEIPLLWQILDTN